jgi:hypothetical protein
MRYRHIRENKRSLEIKEILNNKYNGDITKLKEAESDYNFQNNLYKISNKKKPLVLYPTSHDYICMDIDNDMCSIIRSENPILSAPLDTLSIRKIMPQKPSDLLTINRNKDINFKTLEEKTELQKLFYHLYNLATRANFYVTNLTHNRKNGTIIYNTITYDLVTKTNVYQYGWIGLDMNRYMHFTDKYKGQMKEFIDNNMIYSFSHIYGVSKMFFRCTCQSYRSSYSVKRNGGNFICNHISLSLMMLPYYLFYLLR